MVVLTQRAAKKVSQLLAKEGKKDHFLRLFVQGGGCSGFQYGLSFDKEIRDGDHTEEYYGIKVSVDQMSAMYIEGTEIDYIDGIMESGFKITNPSATRTCGCGSSFNV